MQIDVKAKKLNWYLIHTFEEGNANEIVAKFATAGDCAMCAEKFNGIIPANEKDKHQYIVKHKKEIVGKEEQKCKQ